MTRRPESLPPPCPCSACRLLAERIDADLRARLAVREAAEVVDRRHGLDRPDPHISPGLAGRGISPSAPATSGTTPGLPAVGGPPPERIERS